MLNWIVMVWRKWWARAGAWGAVHYLTGGPSLPPPLTPDQEKELLGRMAAGDQAARDELITHNLRLVVCTYPGSLNPAGCPRRIWCPSAPSA